MAAYGTIAHKTGAIPVGLSVNPDDEGNFEYICGVEVSRFVRASGKLQNLTIPARTYAVFGYNEHIAKIVAKIIVKIGQTYSAIWNDWLPHHDHRVVDGPCLERYLAGFDTRTGRGGGEICIPLSVCRAGMLKLLTARGQWQRT